ncbi:MAG: DoxX family protein [Micromonosporaceae bacterium]|nr:DoxX family protein [Micromonosporaceae bacterium]
MFIVTIVLSGLLAIVFVGTGVRKVPGGSAIAAEANHLGFSPRAYQVIGVLELAAVAGLLIGLAWAPLGIAAAAGLVLLMAGAAVAHRRAGDPIPRIAAPAALCVIAAATVVLRSLSA